MRADQRAIVLEIYEALEKLGASPELLSAVGSWGDTMDDATTLRHLQAFNRTGSIFDRVICRRIEAGH
jgi:hypothetical protein